jgi:hypothetical protein
MMQKMRKKVAKFVDLFTSVLNRGFCKVRKYHLELALLRFGYRFVPNVNYTLNSTGTEILTLIRFNLPKNFTAFIPLSLFYPKNLHFYFIFDIFAPPKTTFS